jgi:endonuclease-3
VAAPIGPIIILMGERKHMAITVNKQRQITQLLNLGKKAPEPEVGARPVLEEFVYGLCREGATPEQADRAYQFLQERFFDWNEIRVSSIRELEEAFEGLPHAESRAQRLIAFLQEVFETSYSFELDGLLKKGLKLAAKQLARYQAHNDYVGAWVIQRSLVGHAIPIDAPTLRCARRLGLVDAESDSCDGVRSTLEHLVPKAKGALFTDMISRIADEFCHQDNPSCSRCPLAGDCPSAPEGRVSNNGSARPNHRTKPR